MSYLKKRTLKRLTRIRSKSHGSTPEVLDARLPESHPKILWQELLVNSLLRYFFSLRSRDDNNGVSDFELMLMRKKEEKKRRKRKDIDIINDNDDIIAQLLGDMRNAAEVSSPRYLDARLSNVEKVFNFVLAVFCFRRTVD